jgi:hypothetical protein
MIPRFSNPHVLQTSTKLISRTDLRDCGLGEDANANITNENVPILAKRLRELVEDNLGNFTFAPGEENPRRKRQKLEEDSKHVEQGAPIRASIFLRQLVQCPEVLFSISTYI